MKSAAMKVLLTLLVLVLCFVTFKMVLKWISFSVHTLAFGFAALLLAAAAIMVWDWSLRRKRRRG
jgi:hypothetical protein